MAQRIETPWLRRLVTVVCLVVPVLVGYARLYRGMHHLTDVLVGLANGLVCFVLAWLWLRRDVGAADAPDAWAPGRTATATR
jgi:undecaprenyl-diphosphatase